MHAPDADGAGPATAVGRRLRLAQLAEAFADPTRRDIYLRLRTRGKAMTAGEVARVFGLHRTAARAQLERLLALGLLDTRTGESRHAGRPTKLYRAVDERLEFTLPARRYWQLAQMVLELLSETLPPDVACEHALALGRRLGEDQALELAGEGVEPPVALFPAALADWMNRSGYEARVQPGGGAETVLEIRNCPYTELSRLHREIVCAFDAGMLRGMLGVRDTDHRRSASLSSGDSCCTHVFTLWPASRPAAPAIASALR